ncbi:hypothetical protein GCM10008107_14300 [Psychrosphaera saromensis]|uniref:SLC41A/MgtE integral membrane domain-containing protein n=1 Tax=Psychrosphaera saromensis TaxID=716813 RepID=A0A2S7UUC5_9GAMM|nr:magnesium transporter [Psychrosphaera saromensis]PQJ53339.1 hypothetical protein BTO11_06425 [Psychrosphaera saromensis]GHB66271.1 hypothetical protein GCM10008107_14300 [Psychrosphaera saromensis]GLQ14886.1 hypothetical protein GCM10007917_23410 [Psychrosphaera saromensis]
MGQVSDEDLFAPIFTSARRRALWLGINLITAFLASAVIGIFDKVLIEVAALSGIIIPMVLDKNGIDPALAGSVILTTVTDVVGFFVFLGSATIIFMS